MWNSNSDILSRTIASLQSIKIPKTLKINRPSSSEISSCAISTLFSIKRTRLYNLVLMSIMLTRSQWRIRYGKRKKSSLSKMKPRKLIPRSSLQKIRKSSRILRRMLLKIKQVLLKTKLKMSRTRQFPQRMKRRTSEMKHRMPRIKQSLKITNQLKTRRSKTTLKTNMWTNPKMTRPPIKMMVKLINQKTINLKTINQLMINPKLNKK